MYYYSRKASEKKFIMHATLNFKTTNNILLIAFENENGFKINHRHKLFYYQIQLLSQNNLTTANNSAKIIEVHKRESEQLVGLHVPK